MPGVRSKWGPVQYRNISATLVLIELIGAVALLLWAMRMTRTGITRAYGGNLRRTLNNALDNRIRALLSGFGVTLFCRVVLPPAS